ncbi:MAG: hypothetical protein DHS20C01_36050 [marine bacterium B5-7]|nr:MAG: hypothetical protein DHS20C01_36050 [marine bacterium B5-7]
MSNESDPAQSASDSTDESTGDATQAMPYVAPCRRLEPTAPFRWLRAGWQDFKAAPFPSLSFGIILTITSWLLAFAAWKFGGLFVLIGLVSGFIFVGPIVALLLYSISSQLEKQRQPKLVYCLFESRRNLGNEALMGLILMIVLLLWARAASMVHVFFPIASGSLADILTFLAIGSIVGSIFALIIFCATAFSLPLIMDRQIDMITAVITSVNAVLRNKPVMAIWAGIIVAGLLICFLTGFIAIAVIIPIIGFATWHGYRDTIDASAWPLNDAPTHP